MNAKRWMVGAIAVLVAAPVASLAAEPRTAQIAVTAKGFEPSHVKVRQGEPLKLVVTRKTDDTCAKEIVIPEVNIKAELPLNKPVTLQFTPRRAGELKYSCGMDMVTGVLEVVEGGSHDQGGASCGCCGMPSSAS